MLNTSQAYTSHTSYRYPRNRHVLVVAAAADEIVGTHVVAQPSSCLAAVGGARKIHFRPGRNLSAAGRNLSSAVTVRQSMPLLFGEMPRSTGSLSKGRVPKVVVVCRDRKETEEKQVFNKVKYLQGRRTLLDFL